MARRAARATFEGRRVDPAREDAGRFLRSDVDALLDRTWLRVTDLLREEDLQRIPTWGNRPGRFLTHWSYCAPLGFVKRCVERHGDRGEVEAFYQSWCLYDWAAADLLASAQAGAHGHYQRPHTLSRGDAVCDIRWSAQPPK